MNDHEREMVDGSTAGIQVFTAPSDRKTLEFAARLPGWRWFAAGPARRD